MPEHASRRRRPTSIEGSAEDRSADADVSEGTDAVAAAVVDVVEGGGSAAKAEAEDEDEGHAAAAAAADNDDPFRSGGGWDAAWSENVERLRIFRSAHGHLNVPADGLPEHRVLLGFMKRQRREYRMLAEGKPSKLARGRRIKTLEDLGFEFEVPRGRRKGSKSRASDGESGLKRGRKRGGKGGEESESREEGEAAPPAAGAEEEGEEQKRWSSGMRSLSLFKARHGHLRVFDPPDLALLEFVEQQRSQRRILDRGGPAALAPSRIAALDALGFEWGPARKNQIPQEVRLMQLGAFKDEFGHTDVPAGWARNESLASFVNQIRCKYNRGAFSGKRKNGLNDGLIQSLSELGFRWKLRERERSDDGSWEMWYERLKSYAEEHGDFGGLLKDTDERHADLVAWARKQLRLAKIVRKGASDDEVGADDDPDGAEEAPGTAPATSNNVPPSDLQLDRFRRLDELGFPWPTRQGGTRVRVPWDERVAALRAYRDEHGHCRVPRGGEHAALASWVATVRNERRKHEGGKISILTAGKIRELDELGFSWTIRGAKVPWEDRWEQLRRYREEFGDTGVPVRFNADRKFGIWVANQRSEYQKYISGKATNMNEDRIRKLQELDFAWRVEQPKTQWDKKFHELRQFKAEFNDCLVPVDYARNRRLGQWVKAQRDNYHLLQQNFTTDLSLEQIAKLERLGFSWTEKKPWRDYLEELRKYKAVYANCNVPRDYPSDQQLANWVSEQRIQYRRYKSGKPTTLNEKKVTQLNDLGFSWTWGCKRSSPEDQETTSRMSWETRFEKLKLYVDEHGSLPLKTGLSAWLHQQHKEYVAFKAGQASKLGEEKAQMLEGLGEAFASLKDPPRRSRERIDFDDRLEQLKQYKEEHGHCMVPRNVGSLGLWVGTQRSEHQKMKSGQRSFMTGEKASQLEAAGFVWTVRGSRVPWEKRFGELREFKRRFGDCSVPARFNANRKLGTWVQVQRAQYNLLKQGKASRITEARIKQLEDIGFRWEDPQPKTHWEKKFFELRQYKAEYGTCSVPMSYERNPRLGKWVAEQRDQYQLFRQGKPSLLTDDHFSRLHALGFVWYADSIATAQNTDF